MEKEIVVRNNEEIVSNQDTDIDILGGDRLFELAEQAEQRLTAIKKIMNASLMITNENDWVLISGVPYLQESGATKVARLFGMGWTINDPQKETRSDGHYTITYKGTFTLAGVSIEAEGARSSYDDFFVSAGKGKGRKSPDEIDIRDVKMAAFTNCINNGIKRLLPGLRNLAVEDLQKAGLNTNKIKGFAFKGDSKDAATNAENSGFKCKHCNAEISSAEASYSKGHYGVELCRKCQALAKEGKLNDGTGNE